MTGVDGQQMLEHVSSMDEGKRQQRVLFEIGQSYQIALRVERSVVALLLRTGIKIRRVAHCL